MWQSGNSARLRFWCEACGIMPQIARELFPDYRQLSCMGAVEGACLLLEHGADA